MTVNNTLGAAELLRKYLESPAGSNLLGEMVKMAAELLMDADVDVICNAGYGERSEDRENSRNGHRVRRWDTRAGTISLDVPKLRHGSYMPGLLEPRRRVEQALVSVVCQAYVEGVSTRRVDDLVKSMGIDGISKSQVSELAKNLDEKVAEFRNRPLDAGPYAYVWLDALFHKVREGGRVVSVATVVATGVSAEGHREILGVDVFSAEDGAGWMAFLRVLVARGLSGVALVVSDAHEGLKGAIAAVLDGAAWQRCRTHAMRNLLTRVPKTAQALVATLVRTIFAQPDVTQVKAQFNRVVDQLGAQFPRCRRALDRRRGGPLGVQRVPTRALAPAMEQQSRRAPEPGDPQAHRRRRHLPEPRSVHPPRRRGPRRATRRVGGRLALHEPRVAREDPNADPCRRRRRGEGGGHDGGAGGRQLEPRFTVGVVVVIHHSSGLDCARST